MAPEVTDLYMELLQAFPPRPIKSEAELQSTQKVIDSLIDIGTLNADQRDYINVLGSLVYDYEQTQEPLPDVHAVELIKALIEDRGLRQKDLVPIFKTESIVSVVLSGQRKLTLEHVQKLAEFFEISPAAFFPAQL